MNALIPLLLMEEAMDVDYESESDDDDDESSSSGIIHVMSGSDFDNSSLSGLFSDDDEDDFSTDEYSGGSNDANSPEIDSPDEVDEAAEPPVGEAAGNDVVISLSSDEPQENGAGAPASPVPLPQQTVSSEPSAAENTCVKTCVTDEKKGLVTPKTDKNVCSQSPGTDDEGQNCPICFETWTSSGNHRLVSLKCGHLFGLSCIERWLKGSKTKCPQCNAAAKKNDIRNLYVRNLKALDTSERDQALKDLEKEKELRRRAELDAANMRLKYQMSIQECEKLKKELMDHQELLQKLRSSRKRGSDVLDGNHPTTSKNAGFVLEKTLDISKEGACRVIGISSFFPMLVITQESTNKLFAGYGIKKISTLEMKPCEFVFIHQKPIRDLAFHSYNSLILTTALDKTVKITNVYSNSVVQTYALPMDAWSCAWNKDDDCGFYAGLKNGTVLQFDTRMTGGHVQQLPSTGHNSPVVALQYVQKKSTAHLDVSGPVSLQLSSCCFYEKKVNDNYKLHPLPVEGNFTSLCLEPSTGHFLVSCRPSVKHAKVTHMFCEMSFVNMSSEASVIDSMCSLNVVQTLHGGSTQVKLSRSKAFLNPGDDCSVLVCAGDDNAQAALIWDVNSGQCLQHLKADSSVLDVCNFRVNQDRFLSTLTERTLRVYRWNRN